MGNLIQIRQKEPRSAISFIVYGSLILLLAATALTATFFRVKGLSLDNISLLFTGQADELLAYTVWDIRLPRVLLAMIIGAALAVSGCLLQGITKNPLADSEVMGVNQGASLFAVIGLLVMQSKDVSLVIMLCAFLGAIAGGSIVYSLSFHNRFTPSRLVMSGIAVSFFFGSLTSSLILMFETTLMEILYWMAGKLTGANWTDIRWGIGVLLPVILISWLYSKQLNVLLLGDDVAAGLGLKVLMIRRVAVVMTSILVGGSVALAGPIGFVGLMVPHMARLLIGTDFRNLLPLSALLGANLLLLSDLAGQYLFYPTETPVGIVTALLGTPFFLYLMRRKKEGIE